MVNYLGYSSLVFLGFIGCCSLFNLAFEDYLMSKDDFMAGIMSATGYFFGLRGAKELQ